MKQTPFVSLKARSVAPATVAPNQRKRQWGCVAALAGPFGLSLLLAGCTESRACTDEEAESGDTDDCSVQAELVTYTASGADVITVAEGWESGVNLRLEGDVREVVVDNGAADDEIVVSYRAEVELLEGRPSEFVEEVMEELVVVFQQRGDTLVVEVSHPGGAALGAHLDVRLPEAFDGELEIQKRGAPGDVIVEFLGDGRSLDVDMEAPTANLLINHTGNVRRARLNAAGDIETAAFASPGLELVAMNSEEGMIDTAFDVVPESHAKIVTGKLDGSRIRGTGGPIAVTLPRDGDFSLAAYTDRRATLTAASACEVDNIRSDTRLMICGAGDPDGLLTFELISSDAIDVELR